MVTKEQAAKIRQLAFNCISATEKSNSSCCYEDIRESGKALLKAKQEFDAYLDGLTEGL